MKTITLHEAQQYKKLLTDTITEALKAFTTQTGLCVDSVNVTVVGTCYSQGFAYNTLTRSLVEPEVVYEVIVDVPM